MAEGSARVTWRPSDGALLTEFRRTRARRLDKPLGTGPLLDKVGDLTRSTFPAIPAVLQRLVEYPQGLACTLKA
jgi:hypothetical protein